MSRNPLLDTIYGVSRLREEIEILKQPNIPEAWERGTEDVGPNFLAARPNSLENRRMLVGLCLLLLLRNSGPVFVCV